MSEHKIILPYASGAGAKSIDMLCASPDDSILSNSAIGASLLFPNSSVGSTLACESH